MHCFLPWRVALDVIVAINEIIFGHNKNPEISGALTGGDYDIFFVILSFFSTLIRLLISLGWRCVMHRNCDHKVV